MIVSNVEGEGVGLVTNLFQLYTDVLSSVPALVGFKLLIDGVVLTPVGGMTGNDIRTFSLSYLHEGEITYERVAAYLVANEINLTATEFSDVIQLTSEVKGYSKTIRLEGKLGDGSRSSHIVIPYTGEITTREREFDCCGEYNSAVFELLFVARKDFNKLPPEFNAFRLWEDWLTLGKSCSNVATVTPDLDNPSEVCAIRVEPKFPELEATIHTDLTRLSSSILPV